MFWRMAGLSTASPVEAILDKENFTLDELLDEDEIIQESKALNGRLLNFLREKGNVKQLIQYIVEEAPENADRQRTFKFPFIACEIFTCEVDIILKALVEDEELMDLLFSFLNPERPHSTQLAGYFSKVVVCLLLRKTTPLMNYIQAHQNIIERLVDLIGITSIMEVLVRLIGADEHIYANYPDSMQWVEDMNVLEMIVDKFSSSDCPEVHANAAEILCAITRYAPPGIASKVSSPSFIGRLFRHALEDSRPKSVLVNLLSVCISLLDPKKLTSGSYYLYTRQMNHASGNSANPDTVQAMLDSLGDLLKLLDVSLEGHVLLTTYGKLQPPFGKNRLKIIEFISVLVDVSSEVAEKELILSGAVKRIIEFFFDYPYNNFLHCHVEHIITSCLESKNPQFVQHLFGDCNLMERILEAEKNFTLSVDTSKPTIAAAVKSPPRIGNIGHITRIANKLIQLGTNNSEIHTSLQGNADWVDWQTNVLLKRNAIENFLQWACGRPTTLQDRARDSDDDDYQDRDYDVADLANNLSQAFRYGIYSTDDNEKDVQIDNESAEGVSSLRLDDDQDSASLFTNSDWFAFKEENIGERLSDSVKEAGDHDNVPIVEDEDLPVTTTSDPMQQKPTSDKDNMADESLLTSSDWLPFKEEKIDEHLSDPITSSLPFPNIDITKEADDHDDEDLPNTTTSDPTEQKPASDKDQVGGNEGEAPTNDKCMIDVVESPASKEDEPGKSPLGSTKVDKEN